MSEGRFIVLEGGDGVGKTTQAALLSAWMTARDIPHLVAREPGGTEVGEAIREIVLGRRDLEMPAESELLLILAARAAFVHDVVRPALAEGKIVLADRFALSTLAYQGYGRGLALDDVRAGLAIATRGLTPHLTILLTLPRQVIEERTLRSGAEPDRIEQEGFDFLARVRAGYLEMAETEPGVTVVDARGAPEDVHARLRRLLETRFADPFGEDVVA